MARTHANTDPVRFDFVAAQRLIAELLNAAESLRATQAARRTLANQAREEWRGVFAKQFIADLETGDADARRLAASFEEAADGVRKLVRSAEREQERRARAAKYEEQQERRSNLAKAGDFVLDQLGLGGDDLPPPPPPEDEPEFYSGPVRINPAVLHAERVNLHVD
ncbi:hypothetical protein M1L60_43650 [Actinoplanes sp. TRM 88003]|uniref:Uncharacterized protein n=1 Tax=Paractinoplanes aksuensis TaxID=2939490 RepID=A0ABT1E2Z4_9ACTN|nr:hypothetical protein [Actinoplanes aksuensis]MCO8277497.1 hypothetical protein [Actinoplanes aksuensis]